MMKWIEMPLFEQLNEHEKLHVGRSLQLLEGISKQLQVSLKSPGLNRIH